jgi:hypothetical protein
MVPRQPITDRPMKQAKRGFFTPGAKPRGPAMPGKAQK